MTETPIPQRRRTPAAADPAVAAAAAARARTELATGILMALVPCSAETARRLLTAAAEETGTTAQESAGAAVALLGGQDEPTPVQEALRTAMRRARSGPQQGAGARLLPRPDVLREHVARFRALRREVLGSPGDLALQRELDDAVYTLCVMMGRRTPHDALKAAETLVDAQPQQPARGDQGA
ncbi:MULTISPECIES: DUF5133 domain-containing protein [unclassified Streptomyces]|uniref:DUF5133 domain-containing protein n=1 Tax=unclassified Streptomyces TaxID=2593676 RepID=UPI002E36ADF5|nr:MULTISPECIES: DUF5133 domain-containing protein [unclassified Streptomyces]WUC63258.1 DUF5133 domain-containing protein [Streptomyces sp. NBC_00539]